MSDAANPTTQHAPNVTRGPLRVVRRVVAALAAEDPPPVALPREASGSARAALPASDLPTVRSRIVVAVAITIASALFSYFLMRRPGYMPDFAYPLEGARLFVDGIDPYSAMSTRGGPPPYNEPLFYPFTTLLALTPFVRLAYPIAGAIFFGLSAGLLAFLITRDGLWRVHIFMGASFVMAANLGQFSPLLMAAAFIPAAGFLATLKPNIGLAILAFRPSWKAVVGCFVVLAVSVAIFPDWPTGWLQNLRHDRRVGVHAFPLMETGGVLLLLALLRWRRRAARLLLVMSIVPQQLFFYDQLPLWLIPRTRQQSILLTAASDAAFFAYYATLDHGDLIVRSAYLWVMLLIYLPALGLVLWQGWNDRPRGAVIGSNGTPTAS